MQPSRNKGAPYRPELSADELLDLLPVGLLEFRADGTIIRCNAVFARDLGPGSADELVGRSIGSLLDPESVRKILSAANELLASSKNSTTVQIEGIGPKAQAPCSAVLKVSTPGDDEAASICLFYDHGLVANSAPTKRDESEEKYRTLFEHSIDGMWLIKDDYFTNANPAAARMLRYDNPEELANTHPSELSPEFQPDGRSSFEKASEMMELAKTNGQHRFEWDHKKKDGEVFPVDVMLTRVPVEGQDLLLCSWRDISEQKKAERTLREARDAARSTTRMQSEFLANMSHEIRTPMTGILGMLSLVPRQDLSERNWTYIEHARNSANALLDLINDILDLSRLEAGGMHISLSPVSIRALVNQVVSLLGNTAEHKGLKLFGRIASNVPQTVMIDENHLRQILLNLAGNALKFTDQGEIVIDAKVDHSENGQAVLVVSVTDTGIGIPKDRQDVIFERFQQIDGSASRSHEGTGLGLSICRQLAELHGGSLSVQSVPGEGSSFTFEMPFDVPEDKEQEPKTDDGLRTDSRTGKSLSNRHVLVAEDNKINQMVIAGLLESLRISYEIFDNGLELLQRLESDDVDARQPDLILMDIQMPVLDGIETTRLIRKLDAKDKADLPILALTAHAMVGQKEEYLTAGMSGYVTKPIIIDELETEIEILLAQKA